MGSTSHHRHRPGVLSTLSAAVLLSSFALGATVTVSAPTSGATVSSPVQFTATASSPTCAKGVSAMGIYTASGVLAYKVSGASLNTALTLSPGTYNTDVQEWDNCGASAKTPIKIIVAASTSSYPLTVAVTGTGTVTSSAGGISCPSTCSASFASGTQVTLTASAGSGYTFTSWTGGGCGTAASCTVTVTAATSVSATFTSSGTPPAAGVTVSAPTNGATVSSPVQFTATASSPTCAKGVSAMGIYTASGVLAYKVSGASLNTALTLSPGTYNTDVQEWDNCGASAKTPIKIIVAASTSSYPLTVAVTGTGTVTSSAGGISCPSTCSASFASGAQVTLTASAGSGYTFTSWTGGGCGTAASCTVTVTAATSVSATFTSTKPSTYTLAVSVSGTGTVTSTPSGISCPTTCSASFAANTQVVLTEIPGTGFTFSGWGGACSGTGTCSTSVTAATSVTAGFTANATNYSLTVQLTGGGTGTVTSTPSGINCPTTCSASFAANTQVALTEVPGTGFTFSGWGGACSGTGACSVTGNASASVTANFPRYRSTQSPIAHLIVVMMQNNSFDHLFGTFPNANGLDPNASSYNQVDSGGKTVHPSLLTDLAPGNVNHTRASYTTAYDGGNMDKYAYENGDVSMGYFDDSSVGTASDGTLHGVETLWSYAEQYALADNFFASAMASEPSNVLYMTSAGVGTGSDPYGFPTLDPCTAADFKDDTSPGATVDPPLTFQSVGDQMKANNISWTWYQENFHVSCVDYVPQENPFQYYASTANSSSVQDFTTAAFTTTLSSGSAPAVIWIQPAPEHSMHPGAGNIANGIEWLDNLIQTVEASSIWPSTAVIVLWDESGGWYDQVPPPQLSTTIGLGARVPVILISPSAKTDYISHQQMDFVSILRFIQWNWNLGQLPNAGQAAREQESGDICDLLSVTCSAPQ
jgi:phospholipase C